MRTRFLTIASALFICVFLQAQEPVALTPATATIAVGQTQTFAVPAGTDLANVTFTVTPETAARFNKTTLTLTALAAGEVSLVGKDAGGNAVTTTPKVTVQPIKISAGSLATSLVEGETRPLDVEVRIDAEGGAVLDHATLKFTSADPAIAKVVGSTIVAGSEVKGSKPTTLAVTLNEVPLGSVPITVLEAIQSISARDVTVQEGKTVDLEVRLKGRHDTEFTLAERKATFNPASDSAFSVSPLGIVQAQVFNDATAQTTRRTVVSSAETFKREGSVSDPATITIVQKPGEIRFTNPVIQLPREGSATTRANVVTRAGTALAASQVTWALKNPDDTKWVKLAADGPALQVIWNRQDPVADVARPNVVEVVATATAEGTAVTGTVLVRMSGAVVGFAPLSVRLNIMDDHTVRDLFGARAAGEYFVARVRLNNNIDAKTNPELAGSSILAFSESLEVAVIYEKRPVNDKNKPTGDWARVEQADLADFEGKSEGEPIVPNDPPPQCSDFFTYRPFDSSMMITTADRRESRSTRGRVFTGLQTLGTVASAVTGVAVPGPTSDWPLALEKYSNLLLPGIEKIWPSLKETHRQNLVSYLMQPLEEIPFGSDISRVLFFPKGSFHGLLRNHQTRVAQICPFHFKIQVAVIEKKQTITAGTAR